ncbi:MAG TPA: hypothetical protein VLF59_00510 [Candidatus Saccharimonadales bacterium]|nr:hypothetical protein [Candidatus Saccharimonadales bacterium]
MSIVWTPEREVLTTDQLQETERVGTEALDLVEARYGSGYPHYRGGENGGLADHNRRHSWAVVQGMEAMADALDLSRTERAIGRTAAAAHDVVQLKARGVMEQESATWLEARLQGLVPAQIVRMGTLAILGTEPILEDGKLTGQVAAQLSYPDSRTELVAKSVACADLGELHSARGPLQGHELYKEIHGVTPADTPDMEGLVNFQRSQVWLAENYHYPHPMGERVFGGLRGVVVDYSAGMLDQLESGRIETWQQLVDHDEAFMRKYA